MGFKERRSSTDRSAEATSGSVHATAEKFENAALFLRLGLLYLTSQDLRFSVDGELFENGVFRKRRRRNHA